MAAIILILSLSIGTRFLSDPMVWPGTGLINPTDPPPLDPFYKNLKVVVTAVALGSSLFPLFNAFGYLTEVDRAARVGSGNETLRTIARAFAFVAVILNAIWTTLIIVIPEHGVSYRDPIFIFLIFGLFSIVDLVLMLIHNSDRSAEGRLEFDFFFGNLFFIDIPLIIGVFFLVSLIYYISDLNGSASHNDVVVDALLAGASVMQVALSQIVFTFLSLQLRMRRVKPHQGSRPHDSEHRLQRDDQPVAA